MEASLNQQTCHWIIFWPNWPPSTENQKEGPLDFTAVFSQIGLEVVKLLREMTQILHIHCNNK
jgi:hypothetical protein